MDTKNASYEAGKAHGKAEEKAKTMTENVTAAAQSAVDTAKVAGAQVQGAAVGAFDAVKNATGYGEKK